MTYRSHDSVHFDRRGVLRGAAATGLALGLAGAGSARAAPSRGGTFRVGVHDGNTTDTWDPATTASILMIHSSHVARAYLTEITNEDKLGPDLATDWQATKPDASEWRFELSREATFHDGRPVTARDVVASINYHRGPESTSAVAELLTDITEIRPDGDHAVIVTLSGGNADLPHLMTDYHLVIQPATEDGGIDWANGIGCGPYRVTDFKPGISVSFERHDGWHRAGSGAWFDKIEMTVLNDANARQAAIVTGDIDAVTDVDLKTSAMLERAPGVILDDVPSGTHITMPMFATWRPSTT